MSDPSVALASLIGSRICHDLVSPVGAIANGIELLGLSGGMAAGQEETALISDSCRSAAARIRFFRVAFGTAAAGQTMSGAEARAILRDVTRGTRLVADWQAEDLIDRAEVQRAFLGFLCVEAALPRGGAIRVARDASDWTVSSAAPERRVDAALWALLSAPSPTAMAEVTPAQVQFPFLALLSARAGRTVRVADDPAALSVIL
ncbi:histidine phosphotransferase family protein [Roseivivax isoporae]|uniref:Histidine phosphotransferase n=1 Tax=Roseivivax isoporae LMG 25204 TaxID=1449351 RepID=X7F449_9RHOB|nr:histidine phosphotransferase family protein [Roseivivax isoporae]ETX27550.1 histidine phosphotransferase [Roseivivax isoporae LMG 25204]